MNIYVVYFWLIFLHVEGLFCIYGEPFLGSPLPPPPPPPPPEQNFLRALMNIWYCCALDRGMGAYTPHQKFLKNCTFGVYI